MGLINAAVPADRLDDEVDAVVTDLLAGPAPSPPPNGCWPRCRAPWSTRPLDRRALGPAVRHRGGQEGMSAREAPGLLGPGGTERGG